MNMEAGLHCTSGEIAEFMKNEMGIENFGEGDILMEPSQLSSSRYYEDTIRPASPLLPSFQGSDNILQLPPLEMDVNPGLGSYAYQPTYIPDLWQSTKSDSSDSNMSTPDALKGTQCPQYSLPAPNMLYNFRPYTNYELPVYNPQMFGMGNYQRVQSSHPYQQQYADPSVMPFRVQSMYNHNMMNNMPMGHTNLMSSFPSKPSNNASKRYRCNICGKGFSRPSSLTTHTYSHTGEKPFRCTVEGCGRQFSVVSNLRRHGKVHQNTN